MFALLLLIVGFSGKALSSPPCNIVLVESLPDQLTFDSKSYIAPTIADAWKKIINNTQKYLKINSYYWSMRYGNNSDSSTKMGKEIFSMLLNKSKTVKILINQDSQMSLNYPQDLIELRKHQNINISIINVTHYFGQGVQHSKAWISDGQRAFVGSANMDWRSLTQIKETGLYIDNCPEIIQDIDKFWNSINQLNNNSKIPNPWPPEFNPKYNKTNPYETFVNGVPTKLFTSTSPHQFNAPSRSDDLDALLYAIISAKKFVWVSVMNIAPIIEVYDHSNLKKYWPDIQNLLIKRAYEDDVEVRILMSLWSHTSKNMVIFLKSLETLSKLKTNCSTKIKVRLFVVPAFNEFQKNIDFARVSHSKYMVTDNMFYVGTSNWSGDYFKFSVGISVLGHENCSSAKCENVTVRTNLENLFRRDWESVYAHDVN